MACSYVIQIGSFGSLMTYLFCERRERIPVFVHDLVGYFHGLLEVGIVRHCLKSASSEFGNMQLLASLEIEPLHQFAREQKTVGISDFFDFDFHRKVVLLVWNNCRQGRSTDQAASAPRTPRLCYTS